jgi:hypothetical protein
MNYNLVECPICKNIFLKTHLKPHYLICKKNNSNNYQKNIQQNNYQQSNYHKNNQLQQYNQQHNQQHNQQNNIQKIQQYKKYMEQKQKEEQDRIKRFKEQEKEEELKKNQRYREQKYELKNIPNEKYTIEKYINPQITNYNDNMLNHFFNNYDKLFYQFVEGKCIALVGPAQSILGTNKGEIIDKFDLVIRLNKSLPLPQHLKNDIGSRTDIIYNSLNTSDFPGENNLNPKLYKKYGVKFVSSSYPFNHNIFHDDILNYVLKYKFELPLKVINDKKFRNFERMLGTRPYTGTCAIMDILCYPIKYLYITGLDFYQTKYYNEYRISTKESLKHTKNSPIHQAKPQLEYLKNLSLFDNRIILDNFLDKLLYHDYYKVIKKLRDYNKDYIFQYGDKIFQKYFEMKISNITFTRDFENKNNIEATSFLTFTDNKNFLKKNNEYCILITNEKNILNQANSNLESKKFIGNFYFNEHKIQPASIYLNPKYLSYLKSVLLILNINNCNTYLVILLTIMLYIPEKHYFSSNEIINNWKLNNDEKKLVTFLSKKKILFLY